MAVAESVNGEVTCALFVGVVTLIAQAGTAKMESVRRKVRIDFMIPFQGVSPGARVQA